jgi:hypothetical protein
LNVGSLYFLVRQPKRVVQSKGGRKSLNLLEAPDHLIHA